MQPVTFIPENSPFTTHQRLWLNGYLAGLLAGRGYIPAADGREAVPTATVPLLILFGSQTGTAEKLARNIAREARGRGCNSRVVDAAAHASIDWSKESNLLIVTSTYGEGDMPDNAQEFWDWLNTDDAGVLSHLHYSVLALGDTNYEHFCAAGKRIDARLEALGAKRRHPLADCDLDYEIKAKTWADGALGAFTSSSGQHSANPGAAASPPSEPDQAGVAFNRNRPFPARLITNRRLNQEGSEKETRHFEISLKDSGLTYEVGDALGVVPTNCPALVEDLLRTLGCDGEEAVPAPTGGEVPLRKALTTIYDITRPSPELLQTVAASNAVLRELLAPERREDLKRWLRGREVIDVLQMAPSGHFAPGEFTVWLKKLPPRLYSISSSPKAHAGEVHLTINIVRHQSHGRARKGVCSTFLSDRVGSQTPVPVFVQTSPGFRLPPDGNTPIIMVGPGTGIAPFRAFLHERRATGARGRNWLFFGEQRAATDFYYRDELEQMRADGHLTQLSTAFSRDQAEKFYVQHRLAESAAGLWDWLQEGAHFYVCGDASRMARDVDVALHAAIETAGHLSKEAAAESVKQLKASKRYQRDVY